MLPDSAQLCALLRPNARWPHLYEAALLCRNHRFSDAFQRDFLADPANCPVHGLDSLQDEPEPGQLDLPAFFKQVHGYTTVAL